MTQVLVTKPGTLSAADKRALRKGGIVPVEADQPQDVRLIQAEGPALAGDDLLFAALSAMQGGGYASDVKQRLANHMLELLVEHRKAASDA